MSSEGPEAPISDLLRRTILRAVERGRASYKALERDTGVTRASIMRFVRSSQSLRLDMADRLAAHFGLELRRGHRKVGVGMKEFGELRHFPANSSALSFLEKPLEEMFRIITAYMDKYGRTEADRPYARNERTTLGIWRSNPRNLVLEEYCGEKECETGTRPGRFDAWFEVDGHSCQAEAKPEMNIAAKGFNHKKAREKVFAIAKKEANDSFKNVESQMEDGSVQHAFGIVFVVPHVAWSDRLNGRERIETYATTLDGSLEELTLEHGCTVLRGRYFRSDQLEEKYYFGKQTYPILDVVILKAMRRR
jgi:hypothetical protein